MRKIAIWIAALVGIAASPLTAAATTAIEGTVCGYLCVVLGKACPADREDAVAAAESTFVVMRPDGVYFTVPNVDRAVLARRLTEKVRVTGTLVDKYRAIQADKIEEYVGAKDSWRTVWSQAMGGVVQ